MKYVVFFWSLLLVGCHNFKLPSIGTPPPWRDIPPPVAPSMWLLTVPVFAGLFIAFLYYLNTNKKQTSTLLLVLVAVVTGWVELTLELGYIKRVENFTDWKKDIQSEERKEKKSKRDYIMSLEERFIGPQEPPPINISAGKCNKGGELRIMFPTLPFFGWGREIHRGLKPYLGINRLGFVRGDGAIEGHWEGNTAIFPLERVLDGDYGNAFFASRVAEERLGWLNLEMSGSKSNTVRIGQSPESYKLALWFKCKK